MNDNEFNFDKSESVNNNEVVNTTPVEPIVPEAPVEPTTPVEPVETTPVEPTEPIQSTEEVTIETPVESTPVETTSEVTSEPVTPEVPVEPVAPIQPTQPVEPEPINMDNAKKKGSVLPIILIVFFLLVIGGCLVYFFFFKDKIGGTTVTTTTTTVIEETDEDFKKEIEDGNISIIPTKLKTLEESNISIENLEELKKITDVGDAKKTITLYYEETDEEYNEDDPAHDEHSYIVIDNYVLKIDYYFGDFKVIPFTSNNKEYFAIVTSVSISSSLGIFVISPDYNVVYYTVKDCLYADKDGEKDVVNKIDNGISFIYYFNDGYYDSTLRIINDKVVVKKGEKNTTAESGGMC